MRELSLHILDLIENSIRAGATIVALTIDERDKADVLEITVEDNGPGLSVPPETALDPYFTTKHGKRTGLGLSLFKAAAEEAAGHLAMGKSALGGVSVTATMQLSHIDRRPMGDLAATLSSVVCTNPDLDVWCTIRSTRGERQFRVSDIAKEFHANERCGLALARQVSEKVRSDFTAVSSRNETGS